MLAASVSELPYPGALPGGCWYEPKWDGFRALATVRDSVVLTSRRGADLSGHFPELVAALAGQFDGVVLDGEVVIWRDGRLDFSAVQQRSATSPRKARLLAGELPANYVIFDLLESDDDLRGQGYLKRRRRLEQLARKLAAPLTLTPTTDDPVVAEQWFRSYAPFGVEGLVIKGGAQPYQPGKRGWLKYRHTRTVEAIVGAVAGPLDAPTRLVLAAVDQDSELRVVGGTSLLNPAAVGRITSHLRPASPDHPWPSDLSGHLLGGLAGQRKPAPITPVEPSTVVEVAVDTAFERGRWRHPVRFVRVRTDVDAGEVTIAAIETKETL